MYRWYCPDKGHILDPFAGGSVRGLVASVLDYDYTGIELRREQVQANMKQIIPDKKVPSWITGDSDNVHTLVKPNAKFDMIFSCPPY